MGVSHAYFVVVSVEDSVEYLHEGITNDEQIFLARLINCKRADRRFACIPRFTNSPLVPVMGWDWVINSVYHESQVRATTFTFLATFVCLSPFSVYPFLMSPVWHAKLGSSWVWSHSAVFVIAESQRLITNFNVVKFQWPEQLINNIVPNNLFALNDPVLIPATKHQLGLILLVCWHIKSKNVLRVSIIVVQDFILNQIIKKRSHVIFSHLWVRKTNNCIEWSRKHSLLFN